MQYFIITEFDGKPYRKIEENTLYDASLMFKILVYDALIGIIQYKKWIKREDIEIETKEEPYKVPYYFKYENVKVYITKAKS